MGYQIENAIGEGVLGQLSVLGAVTFFGILFAAACLFLLNSSLPLLDYMWNSLQLVLDPGNLSDVKTSNVPVGAIAVSMGLTLFGLFVFGGIVGILQEFLKTYLKRLQQGLTEIMEEDHIIILGWTEDSISLIEEFIQSNNRVNGIVILSEQASEEIHHQIKELKRQYPRSKTKFVVREGNIHDESRLKKLNLIYSKNIILGASDDEKNFKTLLTLINIFGSNISKAHGHKSESRSQVKVMVTIYTTDYYAAFNAVISNVPKNLDVLLTILPIHKMDILQKIVAQSILDIYAVPIYKDLFSYQGAELYLLEGKGFFGDDKKFSKKYPDLVQEVKGGTVPEDENKPEFSLEIPKDGKDTIPLGLHLNGINMFEKKYTEKRGKDGKIIYLSTGKNIEGEEGQPQGMGVKYSHIKRIYLIGNPEMCAEIKEEVENNTKLVANWKKEIIICGTLEGKDIKNSLIFYISGGEGEDIKMVRMYLNDAQKYNFNNGEDPSNQIITALLIDSEAMFRISEKVLEKTPCVISNQIVKRMLAQASVSTELLSIYTHLLGSSPNSKEIITISAEPHLKEPKTFKALYEGLKDQDEPYFLMGYVDKEGCTVLCPKIYDKNAEELKFVFAKGDKNQESIEVARLILLGERDKMAFDGKEFTFKQS